MIKFNSNQIDKYLKRLGLIKEEPSLEYLNRLQENHHLNIPFENLDVINNVHIQLTNTHLFDKIINNKRGGFCFELNGLFRDLLNSLRFNVYMIEAGVYNEKLQAFGYMRNHMALIVTINDQKYLTDVGFGDSFRRPISLIGKKTEDVSGKYRIVHYDAYHYRSGREGKIQEKYEYYILEQSTRRKWNPQYKFHYKLRLDLEDYQENCNWIESSPDSGFTQGRTWTIAKEDGRVSLSENGITITHYLQQTKIKYEDEKDYEYYLKKNIE